MNGETLYYRALAIARKATLLQTAVAGPTYLRPSDPLPPTVNSLCEEVIAETLRLRREWE